MIVWGGTGGSVSSTATGGRYRPATDDWTPTSMAIGVPPERRSHVAVWTGREMVIWGGDSSSPTFLQSGGRYDPVHDRWGATSVLGAPFGRSGPSVVWTGTKMIIFGGYDFVHESQWTDTGGQYDPLLDQWSATRTGSDVPGRRNTHTAVWTGSEMLVWGGNTSTNPVRGVRYDPATDLWRPMGTSGVPPIARSAHSAVWDGSGMIVFAGYVPPYTDTQSRYAPATDSWTPIAAATGVVQARGGHAAVWTGREMIIWGGSIVPTNPVYTRTGGRYDPFWNAWSPTAIDANTPLAHNQFSTVWTGRSMILWGGVPAPSSSGSYCGCPEGRLVYRDADGDGFGNAAVTAPSCDGSAPPGYALEGTDCDDGDATVHPGAAEVCDGKDDDCDGAIDEGGAALCDDADCCTLDACTASACVHAPNTAAPIFTQEPSLGACPVLWPPDHGYADFTVAGTGAVAEPVPGGCEIATLSFVACASSQPENGTGTGDGNTTRDCVYEPGTVHMRAERDGACSPTGRVYATRLAAVDVCGNLALSAWLEVGVAHDRGHAPAYGTVYSGAGDARSGNNGVYGAGCGDAGACASGGARDWSDSDPEAEIDQRAALDVLSLLVHKAATGAELSWTLPVDPGAPGVTRFHVYRQVPGARYWDLVAVLPSTSVRWMDAPQEGRSFWFYKVTAVIK
jgi:hypothetical protein